MDESELRLQLNKALSDNQKCEATIKDYEAEITRLQRELEKEAKLKLKHLEKLDNNEKEIERLDVQVRKSYSDWLFRHDLLIALVGLAAGLVFVVLFRCH
jgi:hypothetical protein